MTYTYALMEISEAAYMEIKAKLEQVGYQDQIHTEEGEAPVLDMHGIGLVLVGAIATRRAAENWVSGPSTGKKGA